jgi:hypothetical protein
MVELWYLPRGEIYGIGGGVEDEDGMQGYWWIFRY